MNIKFLSIAIIATLIVFSCTKDPDVVESFSDSIIGEWILTEFERENCEIFGSELDIPRTSADEDGCIDIIDQGTTCLTFEFDTAGNAIAHAIDNGEPELDSLTYTVIDSLNQILICNSSLNCVDAPVVNGIMDISDINSSGCRYSYYMTKK